MSSPEIENQVQVETSNPETQTTLTEQEIKKLIEQAKPTEWKYLLKLNLEGRSSGCGYIYLFGDAMSVLFGDVKKVILKDIEDSNCGWKEELLIIPETVPVVLAVHHWDESPDYHDYIDIYVFTTEGWKVVKTFVPKNFNFSKDC
jgi:hypothetical protein